MEQIEVNHLHITESIVDMVPTQSVGDGLVGRDPWFYLETSVIHPNDAGDDSEANRPCVPRYMTPGRVLELDTAFQRSWNLPQRADRNL